MNVHGIDHVGVTVPDIEEATAFFRSVLAAEALYDTLPRAQGPHGGPSVEEHLGVPEGTAELAVRMLKLPNGPGLELFEFAAPRQQPPALPSDLGWQHVAFYVDDLAEAAAKVTEAGGTVLDRPRPLPLPESGPRNEFLYCRAPWGSTFELVSHPDPQPYEQTTSLRRWVP